MGEREGAVEAWATGFVAASVTLGATVDEALARLAPPARGAVGGLVAGLRAPARPTRAAALAAALTRVAVDVDARRP